MAAPLDKLPARTQPELPPLQVHARTKEQRQLQDSISSYTIKNALQERLQIESLVGGHASLGKGEGGAVRERTRAGAKPRAEYESLRARSLSGSATVATIAAVYEKISKSKYIPVPKKVITMPLTADKVEEDSK